MGVAWEEPPEETSPDWSKVATLLRRHPMEWLKVYEHGRTSWAVAVQIGHVAAVHERLGFETKTADNTRGQPRRCTLFMRFNPDLVDDLAETINNVKD